MHHPRHQHALNALRISAALLLLMLGLIAVMIVALVVGFWQQNRKVMILALEVLPVVGAVFVAFRIVGSSARCSLCFCPVLLPKRHTCHREARKVFGSYSVPVMSGILLHGEFRCPYCNEPTACELKDRPMHR